MRAIFNTIDQLIDHLKATPTSKHTPYAVTIDGIKKYTLSCNSDQAIAAVARKIGSRVESVPLSELMGN